MSQAAKEIRKIPVTRHFGQPVGFMISPPGLMGRDITSLSYGLVSWLVKGRLLSSEGGAGRRHPEGTTSLATK